MKFNELDLKSWKELDINVDSLWLINERDKTGKHANVYHGNFIPQIPNQLIKRYTKTNEIILDPFMGSGTTLFECENLNRRFIGFDINTGMIEFVRSKMQNSKQINFAIDDCDVTSKEKFDNKIQDYLKKFNSKNVHFVILHPPYMDIIKFTDKKEDLSQISDVPIFINTFKKAVDHSIQYLQKSRYFAIVVGDVYKNSEIIPLAFYVLDSIKSNFKVKLKGIIVKNIEGNRGKIGKNSIWRYRALKSDYYIFKHEYILVFKKEF